MAKADHENTEKIMKKLIGLVVILAALVLGGYYGMGLVTERTLKKNVDVVNQSNGLFVDVESYDRGWFTSVTKLNWRFHIPEHLTKNPDGQSITVPAQDYKVQMPLTIYHGPIIFTDTGVQFGLGYAHSDMEIPQAYVEKFSNTFSAQSIKPRLNLSLFVNYLNNSRFHIGMPSFKLIAKQGGEQFEWYGMDSSVSISSSLQNIDGSLDIDGAILTKNKMKATLGKVKSEYALHQTNTGLYLGEASLSLPSLVVTENDQKVLDIEQFGLHSSSDVASGLFNSYFKTSLDKVTAQGKTYGPAVLEMSIKNLDAQVLADINQQANKMQQGADSERQQALIAMLPELPKLFSKGAQFEVSKLSLIMPEGVIAGDLLVSLPKGDSGNPFQLLQKVQGHGKLKITAAVLKELVMASVKQKLLSQPTKNEAAVTAAPSTTDTVTAAEPTKTVESTVAVEPAKAAEPAVTAEPEKAGDSATVVAPPASPASAVASDTQGQPTGVSPEQNKPMTVAEVEQQATAQTDLKLSTLVQSGLLTLQGSEYVIEVNLLQGQLSVNGKPFNPAMMQF